MCPYENCHHNHPELPQRGSGQAEGPFPPHPRGPLGALADFEHHWKHGPRLYWYVTRPLWYLRWRLWSRSVQRGKPWKGTRAAEAEGCRP